MKRSNERKNNRLPGFDYSTPGWYFVTICVNKMECMLGEVVNGKMLLNDFGIITEKCWFDLPNHYNNCKLNCVIVMPNHVHGIVVIEYMNVGTGFKPIPTDDGTGLKPIPTDDGTSLEHVPTDKYSLSEIMRGFKTFSSRRINESGKYFRWQRSFYDHIIRFEKNELENIQRYIIDNPSKWQFNCDNPGSLWY
jgi:REP element-mobilizing transposase RayT